ALTSNLTKVTADFRLAGTAIRGEENEQTAHVGIARGVENATTIAPGAQQLGAFKCRQVEAHSRRRDRQSLGNLTRGHAIRPGPHQQAKSHKAILVSEGRKGGNG